MLPTFIRFQDLKARGIVASWPQLLNLQRKAGFPSGRMLSAQVRAWTEEEIAEWLNSRPTEKTPVRGIAAVAVAKAAERDRAA
jgi:hypothetical protein